MTDHVTEAVARMRAWADEHPEVDVVDLTDQAWCGLALAALGLWDGFERGFEMAVSGGRDSTLQARESLKRLGLRFEKRTT